MMGSLGFDDRAVQNEVLSFIAAETRARDGVRRKANDIYLALRDPNRSDKEVRILLLQYASVVSADRERRDAAEEALNDRIHFRDQPRLEAMLTLFGVIGECAATLALKPRVPER